MRDTLVAAGLCRWRRGAAAASPMHLAATHYSAPCLSMSSTAASDNADVWSLGVVIVEALRGIPLVVSTGGEGEHRILGKLFKAHP